MYKKINKRINIFTNVSAIGTIILLILFGHHIKDAAFPLIGLTALAWFVIIFCSHRKKHRKKNINAQE